MADFFRQVLQDALFYTAAMGAVGYAVFVLLYAAACVAFLPGSVLTLGAGAVFGLWRGFVLVWVGATLGACLSFLIGRYWLRGWVERRVARVPALAAIVAAVSKSGWRVVLLTRLVPLLPFSPLNYAYGVTRIGLGEYALASGLGMMPGILVFVYLGAAAAEVVKAGSSTALKSPAERAFFAVGLLAALAAAWLIARAARKALAART